MRRLPIIAAGFLVFTAPVLATETPDAGPIISRAVDDFIRPAYRDFHAATSRLNEVTSKLCTMPSENLLAQARSTFSETVDSWSRVEIIRFGPVTEQNRLERILFWPDRKSTGLRQVQAAIQKEDPTATNPDTLSGKSVAMQGLGALEFVLFGTDSESLASDAPYRCSFGAAIAENLDSIAGKIENAWEKPDGFAKSWQNPSETNPLYRNNGEVLGELLDVFVTGLEMERDVRIGGFLGEATEKDKPKQALFWRSGQTIPSLAGNLSGMKALFDISGLAEALPADKKWIAKSIGFEFNNALNALASADGPIEDVLADSAKRGRLTYTGVVTSSLSELFGTRLSAEFGLTAGFSSLDGD
ncbi:peptidase M75, Imelysin [Pseudaminobacter arsenicus]|uniref:Peptidase M75, Imelysin n=1 Tax=Borborobacter arsenicus TaxID=1851146 RepID=A0A432V4H7_9HYPH|nr:imelysin family protein [Pseudaminobacter arsenicus]RUM97066.1 peptidase M75, Imelysin [Pseudaminobacter arsenicus]